jgi:hypothetical protein
MWVFIFDLEKSTRAGLEKIDFHIAEKSFFPPQPMGGRAGWHSEILSRAIGTQNATFGDGFEWCNSVVVETYTQLGNRMNTGIADY